MTENRLAIFCVIFLVGMLAALVVNSCADARASTHSLITDHRSLVTALKLDHEQEHENEGTGKP